MSVKWLFLESYRMSAQNSSKISIVCYVCMFSDCPSVRPSALFRLRDNSSNSTLKYRTWQLTD